MTMTLDDDQEFSAPVIYPQGIWSKEALRLLGEGKQASHLAEVLLAHFKERVVCIDEKNGTCTKMPMESLRVPTGARVLADGYARCRELACGSKIYEHFRLSSRGATMTPEKDKAAGGDQTALLSTQLNNAGKSHKQQPRRSSSLIEVTVFCSDSVAESRVFRIKGAAARSLQYLHDCVRGLTRIESLEQYRVLSLTQHVHTLRRKFGLDILTERIPHDGRDGHTNFGRYHLLSQISIRDWSRGGE